jgi:cell division protein FtsB
VVLIAILLALAIFGEKGVLRAIQYNRQKQALEEDIRKLEETSAGLRREIEALRSDLRTIEGIARRDLGMVKEDELVYQFRSKRSGSPGPAPQVSTPQMPQEQQIKGDTRP